MEYTGINMSIAYTLMPAAVIVGVLMSMFLVFCGKAAIYGVPSTQRVEEKGDSVFLTRFFMEYWYWVIAPIQRAAVKVRVSPDAITVIGTVVAGSSGIAFYYGYFVLGGWLMIFGGTFDILDGAVARSLGISSKAGAFLDSTLDRYGELFSFAGLVGYYADSPFVFVVFAAVIGSSMVSYTRARAEGVGVDARMGNMQRPERILYLGLGTAFAPIVANIYEPAAIKPHFYLTMIAVTIVAIFSNATAYRRLRHTYSTLKARERAAASGKK